MAFPSSIEAQEYFGNVYNNLSTTLSQICGISDTTVYVASTANFPSSGWITIEDELRSYTGKTSGSFTGCTPGVDNTTAAEHMAGKAVSLTLPAIMWNRVIADLRAALTKIGVDASIVTTTHDYKLSGVTGTDKSASKTGTETLTNKTLTSPVINTPTGDVATLIGVQTLTNKRITERVGSVASSASLTIDINSYDQYKVTALAEAITLNAPSGTPTDKQGLLLWFKDNGTARAIDWNVVFNSLTATLPTITVINKWLVVGLLYNSINIRYECVYAESEQ